MKSKIYFSFRFIISFLLSIFTMIMFFIKAFNKNYGIAILFLILTFALVMFAFSEDNYND